MGWWWSDRRASALLVRFCFVLFCFVLFCFVLFCFSFWYGRITRKCYSTTLVSLREELQFNTLSPVVESLEFGLVQFGLGWL